METTSLGKMFTRNNIIIVLAILIVLAFFKKNEKMFNNNVEEDTTEPDFFTNIEGFQLDSDGDDLSNFNLSNLELIEKYRKNTEQLNNIVDSLKIPIIINDKNTIKNTYDKVSDYLLSKITYKTLEPIDKYKSWHLIEIVKYHNIKKPTKTLQIIEKNARNNSKNNQANPEEYSDIVMRHRHTLYKLIKIKLLEVANDVKEEKISIFESRETIMLNERDRLKKEQEEEHDNSVKKYNKAFNDYLEYQENQKANINLLQVGKMAEDGIYSIFDLKSNDSYESFVGGSYDNDDNDDLIEGFKSNNDKNEDKNNGISKNIMKKFVNKSNPQLSDNKFNINKKVINKPIKKVNKPNINSEDNEDEDNEDEDNEDMSGYNTNFTKYTLKNKYNDDNDNEDIDDTVIKYIKHLSANILEFALKYYNKYGKNILDFDKITKDNQTMIGSGILFIIISLGLYFIDITL